MHPIYQSGRLGTVLFVDEVFATALEDLLDIETISQQVFGNAVRIILVGDPFQIRHPTSSPACMSPLLSLPKLAIYVLPSYSHRTSHPWIVEVVCSLRSRNTAVAADRLLTMANFFGNRRLHTVEFWLVATHAEVDARNRRWQTASKSEIFVGESVNATAAPHKFPARLVAGRKAMFTEAYVVKGEKSKKKWSRRTHVLIKTWGRNMLDDEKDDPPSTLFCSAGDIDVKVLVEPFRPDGTLTGVDVWVTGISASEVPGCRWFPLQGLGAMTADCSQGMTFPKNLRIGIDGTDARDERAWWTVALTRSQLDESADIRDHFVINYEAGAVCREAGRLPLEIELRNRCLQ
jgi:hypothetical protein